VPATHNVDPTQNFAAGVAIVVVDEQSPRSSRLLNTCVTLPCQQQFVGQLQQGLHASQFPQYLANAEQLVVLAPVELLVPLEAYEVAAEMFDAISCFFI